jgi:hypothetical protein
MEGFQFRSFDCGMGSQIHRGHISNSRHVKRSVRISRTALSCSLHIKGYGTFYVAAVVKLPLSLSCLFLSPHNLQEYHTTSFPHTGRTESVQRSSRRGGCPGPLLAARPLPDPLRCSVAVPTPHLPVRPVCWWLRQAWDSLAPNDLLYVSAAPRRAPNPACARRRQVKRSGERPPLSSGSRGEPVP